MNLIQFNNKLYSFAINIPWSNMIRMKSVEKTTGKISDYLYFIDLEFQVYAWLWISLKIWWEVKQVYGKYIFKYKIS